MIWKRNKATAVNGGLMIWWSRRELNPRPQVLYRQYYILSLVI